ncbi:MAG: hypothetical protein EON98_00505 [Chitinophagaceae bacterium]|nr:MAG: hypothetical protein EON98_00505 [Chitinophagaceae bacterium]
MYTNYMTLCCLFYLLCSTSMIRIFIGIVKCGAWGCFDEFKCLKEDQLSAISQQIQIIQDAIKVRTSPISLLGRSVDVDFNSGIFVKPPWSVH